MTGASERIIGEVQAWPGVSVGPGDRGASVAFSVGRREIELLRLNYERVVARHGVPA